MLIPQITKNNPLVLIVGGSDIDSRLHFMQSLQNEFCFKVAGTENGLRSRFQEIGFEYHTYSMARTVNPPKDLLTLYQLWQIFQCLRPQVVHTFDTKPNVLGRLAAYLANVPVVIGTVTGMGSLYTDPRLTTRLKRYIYEPLQRLASNLSDLTIFYNQNDCEQFIAKRIIGENKTRIIPGSGVRTDIFDPGGIPDEERERVRKELGISSGGFVVTMISRLIRSKGINEFVTAARIVRRKNHRVCFSLVGPADEDSVDGLTPKEIYELRQFINWLGPRQDIQLLLAATDVFVLPSYGEGLPRVLMEAASMGLPMVTSNVPGCKEVVEHEVNGILVEVGDTNSLAQAILRLIEHPEIRRYYGEKSRHLAVSRFDLSKVADQTRLVYRELLGQKTFLFA
jgi:glycosyltransferase involved in cell wall biosynthesis